MTRRRCTILAALVALLASTIPAAAHDEYRIIGTVMSVSPKTLIVKQAKDGKSITMTMDKTVEVLRDKKKVRLSELKVGLYVVVIACGDSIGKLAVMEVNLVPPPK